ncbi:Spo0B domain-containing protein [Brevibacillus dissolubilis]|uniref:Spo0B domain-containing protein n=1 Tax=Brevibacillus dissolubilis TaxID=1844116 RepID=UPI0011161B06|nr:Spo0B domain-containing protein [Brevibacillus dissolubilis]
MKEELKLFTEQAGLLLQVLNQQRHDWLNHFQVLLANIQLGRTEDAQAYMKRVIDEAHQESLLTRINSPLLSVFFLTFNALHNDLHMEVEVQHPVDLSRISAGQDEFVSVTTECIHLLHTHLDPDFSDVPSVLVSLHSIDGAIHIRFDFVGKLRESIATEVENLITRAKISGAHVAEQIESENEWVLELAFPCT